MIHLHSGYIFGKYVSEGMKPQPLASNILYENGIFNSLYTPDNFNIFTNINSIDQGPPYDPVSPAEWRYHDYSLEDFSFPEGSLTDGSTFYLTIHGNNISQQGVEITDSCIKMTHTVIEHQAVESAFALAGIIVPIKDFASFMNVSSRNKQGIYIRYRVMNNTSYNRGVSGEVGYSTSSTTMATDKKSTEPILVNPDLPDGVWYDMIIYSIPYNRELDPNYSYFLKIGYYSSLSDQGGHTTLEIDKIWSDRYPR